MIPFPDKKYSVIYADPPWSYSGGGAKRNVTRHYHTMKAKDIYDLPVQDIAADDCLLFMWATFPNLEVALETIRRWGFQYKTAAFVWVKRNRKSPGWFWGLGNWTRANPEVCLLATKGKPIRASRSVHSIIDAPIGRHSEKPAETRDRIAALAGGGAMIELFARQAAQEAAHSAPEAQDDIFHELTRNGLSVAVCPLPVLNQVNITITDGKTVSMTRNVAPAGGIVSELLDMKDTLKEVTP